MSSTPHAPTDFVRAVSRSFADDTRVEALWIEGEDDSVQWPPYEVVDLHFGVPEPFVDAIRAEWLQLVPELAPGVRDLSQQEAPLKGWAGTGVLSDGTTFSYRIERTSQMAKVPRRAVNVLIDRTGGLLLPSLSFE